MNNTIEILINAKDAASSVIDSIGNRLQSAGGSLMKWGAALTVATAGIGAVLTTSTQSAIKYNESITNTAAVLGLTTDQQKKLSDELLKFGATTKAGPQAVADAYYDIAGGVADATTHMAILEAATKTAEAGNTDLAGTTKALISVMNSYKLSAKDASMVSDVLTQVVGKGVGTMEDFASALPNVTGLANSLGVSFTDVGSATAFLTTKGNTASVAVTQLRAMMVALLNPNANMQKGLKELGYTSGAAAIKSLGLVGAMKALQNSQEAGTDGFASMAGSVEALNGVISLTSGGFEEFNKTFADTANGATEAARKIQNSSPAAQMQMLQSTLSALQISIGNALLPALNGLFEKIKPIIDSVLEWVQANPELTGTIVGVAAALVGLGPILVAAGAAIGVIASPIGLVVGAIAGLIFLLKDKIGPAFAMFQSAVKAGETPFNALGDTILAIFGENGVTKFISQALSNVSDFVEYFIAVMNGAGGGFQNLFVIFEDGSSIIQGFIEKLFGLSETDAAAIADPIINGINGIVDFITNVAIPALGQFINWFINDALPAVVSFVTGTVVPAVQSFFTWLGNAWTSIQPGLAAMADWFLNTALPAVVGFVRDVVLPAVQNFFTWLGNAWNTIRPGLEAFAAWFLTDAIPAVVGIVRDVVIPLIQHWIDILVSVWNTVEPVLSQLANWFITDVMPQVVAFIQDTVIPAVQHIIDIISSIWNIVGPVLDVFGKWFTQDVLPAVVDFINGPVTTAINGFINILKSIWDFVRPGLEALRDGIKPILDAIIKFFQPVIDFVNNLINRINDLKGLAGTYQGAAQNASTAVNMVTSGQVSPGQFISAFANAVGAEIGGPHALGVDFVPRPQVALLHRGERVMTANENANFGQSGMTFNFSEGSVIVNGNTREEGAAAADGFFSRLNELAASRDVMLAGGG